MAAQHQNLFEAALESSNALRAFAQIVSELIEAGASRESLLEELQAFTLELRASGKDADEDVVLNVMDSLAGWSSQSARI